MKLQFRCLVPRLCLLYSYVVTLCVVIVFLFITMLDRYLSCSYNIVLSFRELFATLYVYLAKALQIIIYLWLPFCLLILVCS